MSPADRINVAEAALEKAISMLGPDAQFDGQTLGYTAQLYSQMAQFDIATNQTKYADTLRQYFLKAPRAINFSDEFVSSVVLRCIAFLADTGWPQLDYALAWGHAAATAYIAYNDSVFLGYAVQSWWFGRSWTLSSDEVNAGKVNGKDFPIIKECQSSSMVGGTFHSNDADTTDIDTLATGSFFVLSALLAEMTNTSMYLQAAKDSWAFIDSHLRNLSSQIQDVISVGANQSCQTGSLQTPNNGGLTIEGLAILYAQTGDSNLQTALNDIVVATILDSSWQHPDGVLIHGDLYLLRGLTTFYTCRSIPDLLDSIGHYITVQFNAVIDLTTANGSNVYGNDWWGPPSSTFFPTNQSNAIGAQLGAISLRNTSNSTPATDSPTQSNSTPAMDPPTPSSSATPAPTPGPQKSSNVAAIIGSVCAAVAMIMCGLLVWLIRRRRLRNSSPVRLSPFNIWENVRRRSMNIQHVYTPDLAEVTEGPTVAVSAPPAFSKRVATRQPTSYPQRSPIPAEIPPVGASAPLASSKHVMARRAAHPPAPPSRSSEIPPAPAPARGAPGAAVADNLATEELVRLLAERLQGREWDAGEAPPEYPL
ncbi:hypothetical protein C8R46DRAFT_259020 [Mycena filopes]|nr:hypothetical protein C8R46DRAFT_259020 [Mycena filopes]